MDEAMNDARKKHTWPQWPSKLKAGESMRCLYCGCEVRAGKHAGKLQRTFLPAGAQDDGSAALYESPPCTVQETFDFRNPNGTAWRKEFGGW